MNYKRLVTLPLLLIFITNFTYAGEVKSTEIVPEVEPKELDSRAQVLSAYFASYNSPLEYHAQDFIDAADKYGVDWKLVPAIAGVESTFGKFIPGGYNAWGWGVYGTRALYFKSWRDGIFTVTDGLKENYINKGLTDPYKMNRVYAASPSWGWKVSYFMNHLDAFAKQNGLEDKGPVSENKENKNKPGKVAGSSARLSDTAKN